MGYDIASTISIKEEQLKMTGSFASSNVTPKTYERVVVNGDYESIKERTVVKAGLMTAPEVFLTSILTDMVGGMIQFNRSVYVKYRYALYKLINKLNDNGYEFTKKSRIIHSDIPGLINMGIKTNADLEKEVLELKKYVHYFQSFIDMPLPKGRYFIKTSNGAFIKKINSVTYQMTINEDLKKIYEDKWSAELESKMVTTDKMSVYNVNDICTPVI